MIVAVLLLVASLAAIGWSVWRIWNSARVPGRAAFVCALLGNLWWVATTLAQVVSPTVEGKILASEIAWFGNTAAPLFWGLSIHSYVSGRAEESRLALGAIAGFAVFALIAGLTNDLHHGVYVGFDVVAESYGIKVVYLHGWLFWTIIAVCYTALGWGVVASLRAARGAPLIHRRQFFGLLVSVAVPWILNALTLSIDFTIYGVDPEPFGFLVSAVILSFVFFRERLFVVAPIAGEVLFEAIPDPVVAVDRAGRILELNEAARRLPGMAAEPVGAPLAGPDELVAHVAGSDPAITTSVEISVAVSGRAYDVVSRPLAARADGGRLLILRDVTESRAIREELIGKSAELQKRLDENEDLQRRLRRLADYDHLTGLFNRGHAQRILPTKLSDALAAGRGGAFVLLDVDRFKTVNDGYGHQVGDEVLRVFAEVLRADLPADGLAFRYGGEEFLVVLPGASDRDAEAICARWRARIGATRFAPAPDLKVGFSAGVATYPDAGGDLDRLVRAADVALYTAKISGRDRVVLWGDHARIVAPTMPNLPSPDDEPPMLRRAR